MGKLGLNSGYIGSDQRITKNGVVGLDKFYLERKNGRFNPVLENTFLLSAYPGAAAAYSLRRLSQVYPGSAIRVRRSSDNTEQDIGFDGLNLDTAALLTFCGAGDGFVTIWYDQSGNGNDAEQTTASNQPKIYDSVNGVIEENGKPSVQFTQLFQQQLITTNTLEFGNSNRGEFVVGSSITANINACFYSYGIEINGKSWVHTPETAIRVLGGNNIWINSPHTTQKLAYIEYLGTTTNDIGLYLNNALQTPSSTVTLSIDSGNGPLYIGSFYNGTLDGNIQELIIYDSDQSSNRTDIESNINDFYNIY